MGKEQTDTTPDYLRPLEIKKADGSVMTPGEAADFIAASGRPAPEATTSPESVQPLADQDSEQPMQPAQ